MDDRANAVVDANDLTNVFLRTGGYPRRNGFADSQRPTAPQKPKCSLMLPVVGGSLESSNVDIADEFTKLIIFQRSYSANARVITTSDEISQETINLKR